ncbi:hypothetical protein FSP39_022990 [Pinctada imbricata]|uniref:CUB domain-containing protein n=1 Tax=Pinctada imbricata TaxID=66713 RepID=A0AA88YFI5_PINIB|nr:hypothetical protein FSP39_022990 [Pinctada imbricata]
MDSHSQCGKTFEIGENSAQITGGGTVQSVQGPATCVITLSTDALKEYRRFSITIGSAQISDQDVNFYVYDGQSTSNGARLLDSFSYRKAPGPNYKPLTTSGGFVTFYLKKQSSESLGYNINIFVISIPGNPPNPDNCVNGQGHGCENIFNYNPVVTKEQITYIVGGIFGVILLIIPVVVIYCYFRQKGVTKRWNEHKLSGVGNTAASIAGSGAASGVTTAKEPWASQSSRQPYASSKKSTHRSRKSNYSYSEGSLTDDDIPPKNPPPPPPYSEHDRYRRYDERGRSNRRYDYDDRSDRFERDDRSDRFEREERRQNGRSNNRPKDRFGDAAKNSYVQADDDHPQEAFVEKVIKPRVQPRSAGRLKKSTATQDDDDPYDCIDDTAKVLNQSDSDAEKTDRETQVDEQSESEENPQTESEYQSSSEEGSESEEEKVKVDPRKALYAQPKKVKNSKSKPDKPKQTKEKKQQPQPQQPPLTQPGVMFPAPGTILRHPLQPGYPQPVGVPIRTAAPIRPIQPGVPRPLIHPAGVVRPVYNPMNQFQPVPGTNPNQFTSMANPTPAQFQPIRFSQPPRSAGLLQTAQPHPSHSHNAPVSNHATVHNTAPQPRQPDMNVNNTPVFSHLVQRGYDPNKDAGRYSPISSIASRSHHSNVVRLDDSTSDGGQHLGSGVELMKRTTEV